MSCRAVVANGCPDGGANPNDGPDIPSCRATAKRPSAVRAPYRVLSVVAVVPGSQTRHMDAETIHTTGASFDDVVLPHLVAARRLARWLMRNEHDADDVVQDASLRALRYFRTFTGGSGRAWFLRIVRNTCYSRRGRMVPVAIDIFDEEQHTSGETVPDPETLLLRTDGVALVARALSGLPERARELLVRRELDGLSYQELADEMGIPIGTVMSSLSRARRALRSALDAQLSSSENGAESRPGREIHEYRPTTQKENSDAIVHGKARE